MPKDKHEQYEKLVIFLIDLPLRSLDTNDQPLHISNQSTGNASEF